MPQSSNDCQLFQARRVRARKQSRRQRRLFIQELEPRIALSHTPTTHIHPVLSIILDGEPVEIPANIGLTPTRHYNPHTHDTTGTLHIGEGGPAGLGDTVRFVTLDDFFDVWRETDGPPGRNPNAIFNQNQIMDRVVDATHTIQMTVNGVVNNQFENYIPHDRDQILIRYGVLTTSWQNAAEPTDVNGVGGTTPIDALLVINELTARIFSSRETGILGPNPTPPPFLDVNNDTLASALDAVMVINALPSTSQAPLSSGTSSLAGRQFLRADEEAAAERSAADHAAELRDLTLADWDAGPG